MEQVDLARGLEAGSRSLLIIGQGGHSRVVSDVARSMGFVCLEFCEFDPVSGHTSGCDSQSLREFYAGEFVVAIGDNSAREDVQRSFVAHNPAARPATLVHPSSVIAPSACIGRGTVIMPLCVVNAATTVGDGVILNTRASVDHDNLIEDYASIAPGSTTGGHVAIGKRAIISIGAVIRHRVSIGNDVLVGAGAVVLSDVENNGLVYGVPARWVRSRASREPYL